MTILMQQTATVWKIVVGEHPGITTDNRQRLVTIAYYNEIVKNNKRDFLNYSWGIQYLFLAHVLHVFQNGHKHGLFPVKLVPHVVADWLYSRQTGHETRYLSLGLWHLPANTPVESVNARQMLHDLTLYLRRGFLHILRHNILLRNKLSVKTKISSSFFHDTSIKLKQIHASKEVN